MRKVFTVIFTILCVFAYSQQISAYSDKKIGVGLNGDKFFSPEFQLSIERHTFFTQYYLFEPSLGCKVRYYRGERGFIYSGAFAKAVYAYNIDNRTYFDNIVPDVHLVGFEVYPFEKYFAGFSIFVRSVNFNSLTGEWAFLVRF